jgi:hypothetical protein
VISFLQTRYCNFTGQLHDVTQHDFIFSNHFNHRLARHIAFFFACYLFFLLLYYIPYAVFPAWNTSEFAKVSGRLGFPTWLKWRIVNSLIIFLPNLVLAMLLSILHCPGIISTGKMYL